MAAEQAGDEMQLDSIKMGAAKQDGLVTYLKSQAISNPGPFMALLGKVLPLTIAGDKDNPLLYKDVTDGMTPQEAAEAYASTLKQDARALH